MEILLHILVLCPDSISHLDALDINQFPIIELINLFRNNK
jgi:hypothetical protein